MVLERAVHELAQRFNMEYSFHYRNKLKRIAMLVSKQVQLCSLAWLTAATRVPRPLVGGCAARRLLMPLCPFALLLHDGMPAQDHCLYDLLIRNKSGELNAHIPLIISNHPDLGHIADMFGVPFKVRAARARDP